MSRNASTGIGLVHDLTLDGAGDDLAEQAIGRDGVDAVMIPPFIATGSAIAPS